MSDDSTTQCLLFPGIFRKPIVAQFDQREGSFDGGALLLKAAAGRYGLLDELTACLGEPGRSIMACARCWSGGHQLDMGQGAVVWLNLNGRDDLSGTLTRFIPILAYSDGRFGERQEETLARESAD
jgi:hypothetical protein